MEGDAVLTEFKGRIEGFVQNCLVGYNPKLHIPAQGKSIRDAVWGTARYHPWEIAILDSPLLQRLRDIRQTGLAYLVYPTAVHTRFDHTLGMMSVASRIVSSINEKHPGEEPISSVDHMRTRLSALLHDVGHSALSHVSEAVFSSAPECRALLTHINSIYGVKPKAHEAISWLIVKSEALKHLLDGLGQSLPHGRHFDQQSIDAIANDIIGYREDSAKKFLADIINGPMDADKLDYLVRDAYFAGPTVVYDLERFLQTVDAIQYPRDKSLGEGDKVVRRLSIPIEGVTALEQIVISKLMLFSYLYHHHKIRCVEGMYHEALKRIVELSRVSAKPFGKLPPLDHPAAFFALSDRSLLPITWPTQIEGDKVVAEMIDMLAKRELYKRALIISRLFIADFDNSKEANVGLEELIRRSDNPAELDALRDLIVSTALKIMSSKKHSQSTAQLRRRFTRRHVLIDLPKSPTVEETESVMIPVSSESRAATSKEWKPLVDVFPIGRWVDAYNAIKWRGHIFTLEEAVPFVNAAALEVLSEPPFHLHFTRHATELCKITNPIAATPHLFSHA